MRREYPADLWLTYRAIRYRPAQLQAFVARGGWGPGYQASDCRMAPEHTVNLNAVSAVWQQIQSIYVAK